MNPRDVEFLIHDEFGADATTSTPTATPTTVSSASKISPSMRKKMLGMPCKVLLNGDGNAGKTCFLICAMSGEFPQDYVPSVFEKDYAANIRCNKYDVTLNIYSLWNSFGRSDYDRLRPLSYPGTDLMVLCFDVTSRVQFDNCFNKYLPEVVRHEPKAKLVLLGLKTDLRTNEEVAQKLAKHNMTMVSREEAEAAAAKFRMPYFEVSALEDVAGISATLQSFASLLVERRLPAVTGDEKTSGGLFGFVKRLFSWTSEKQQQQQQQQQVEQEQADVEDDTAATAMSA